MAYTITASADRLTGATTAIPTTGSLAMRVMPSWAQADGIDHFLYEANAVVDSFSFRKWTDNTLYLGWFKSGSDHRIKVLTANYTLNQNAWNTFVWTWVSGGASFAYLNGAQIGTVGTTTTFTTSGIRTIGNTIGGSLPFKGDVADVGIWSAALDAAEVASYHAGMSPPLIRLGALENWLPMIRDMTDPVGADTQTLVGSTVAAHPRVYYASQPCLDWSTTSPVIYTSQGGAVLWTSNNWSVTTLPYFEADFRAVTSTAYVRLYDVTSAAAVANSTLSTTSQTRVRLRSSALVLTSGHEYRIQTGHQGGKSGTLLSARLVVL